jgi:hypothetical protein
VKKVIILLCMVGVSSHAFATNSPPPPQVMQQASTMAEDDSHIAQCGRPGPAPQPVSACTSCGAYGAFGPNGSCGSCGAAAPCPPPQNPNCAPCQNGYTACQAANGCCGGAPPCGGPIPPAQGGPCAPPPCPVKCPAPPACAFGTACGISYAGMAISFALVVGLAAIILSSSGSHQHSH